MKVTHFPGEFEKFPSGISKLFQRNSTVSLELQWKIFKIHVENFRNSDRKYLKFLSKICGISLEILELEWKICGISIENIWNSCVKFFKLQ